jgi:hypothetical protein
MGMVNYNKGASGNNAILLRNVDPNLVYPVGLVIYNKNREDGVSLSDNEVAFFPLEVNDFSTEVFEEGKNCFLYDYEDYDIQKLEAQKTAGKLYISLWASFPTSYSSADFVSLHTYKGKTYFYLKQLQ